MSIGFTGTQRGMTPRQAAEVERLMWQPDEDTFHHGLCVGADEDAHGIAVELTYRIIGHPPINDRKLMHTNIFSCDELREPKDYLVRNHDIVDETSFHHDCHSRRVRRTITFGYLGYHKIH